MARQASRERILEVAAQLFMEHGFAATSVRMIGEVAGISQSSLYHHVGSKGQILVDLHRSFADQLARQLADIEATDALAVDKVQQIVHVLLTTVERHQARVTVYLRESHALAGDELAAANAARDEVDFAIDRILRDGIDRGELRHDLDVHLTRLAILGMCNWSYQWFRPDGDHSASEIAARFADVVLAGIATS